jgi:hypothetical protein
MLVKISDIKIRQNWNIRKAIGASDLARLTESIKQIGLQHPVVLNANYELVAGYRRIMACKNIGLVEIPATIIEYASEIHERIAHIDENILTKSLSEKELEIALSEKKRLYLLIHPKSSNPGPKKEDNTRAFAQDAAEKTGRAPREINRLTKRVDDVTDEVRIAYEESEITSSQIDEIARIPKNDQNLLLERAKGLSVAETKLMVDDYKNKAKAKKDIVAGKLIDDKNIEVILEAQRISRSIKTTDVILNAFINGNKFVFLDEENYNSLLATSESLHETLTIFLSRLQEN